jgi:hypothetical protein
MSRHHTDGEILRVRWEHVPICNWLRQWRVCSLVEFKTLESALIGGEFVGCGEGMAGVKCRSQT